jgi:translation initiation factor 2 beta subunit (eIF-2beta)/eIF-5
MWQELKQKLEQKRQELSNDVYSRKEDIKEKYRKRFPKPNLEKPETHLLEENHEEISAQSARTTRLILKFRLI